MKHILLVDDSQIVLTSISKIVTYSGYPVETCLSGAEALEKIAGGYRPDIVITDLNMPEMDGYELIDALRKLPACRFIPILVLTTESGQPHRERAKASGATGWLTKPVSAERLFDVLRQVLPA